MVRSESLSSTIRICARGETKREGSAQPAGRNSGLARLLFDVGDHFLALLDVRLDPLEILERLLTIVGNLRTFDGIVARGEVSRQCVDTALERFREHLVPTQLVAR